MRKRIFISRHSRGEVTLVGALFISIGLMPFVPSLNSIGSLIFAAIFLLFCVVMILQKSRRFIMEKLGVTIILFCLAGLPSWAFLGVINNNDPTIAIRGMIPFFFIVTYIFALQCDDFILERVPEFVMMAAAVWAALIFTTNFSSVILVLSGRIARLTYNVSALLVPLGLLGYIACLYTNRLSVATRVTIAAPLVLLVILSGYRSQLLLLGAVTLFRYRNLTNKKALAALIGFSFLAASIVIKNVGYVEMMVSRFSVSAGDETRAAERAFAKSVFAQFPIFGEGFSVQVPIATTRPVAILDNFTSDSVSYIHNFFWYLLMNLGVSGLAFFVYYFLVIAYRAVRLRSVNPNLAEYCLVTLGVMISYFQISASFRQIQMWVLFSFIAAALYSTKRRGRA